MHGVVELPPAARAEFLASLTGADAELAPELEALDKLENGAAEADSTVKLRHSMWSSFASFR